MDATYQVLIADFPPPLLRTYPVYTVVAEKLHAIVLLGMTNSRPKDYLDLSVLLKREVLDPATLAAAIAATFTRRGTALPTEPPIGLSDEFANDQSRQTLWAAFLKKNALLAVPLTSFVICCTPHCNLRLSRQRQQANRYQHNSCLRTLLKGYRSISHQINVTASRSKSAVIGRPRFSNAVISSCAGRTGLVQRARIFLIALSAGISCNCNWFIKNSSGCCTSMP